MKFHEWKESIRAANQKAKKQLESLADQLLIELADFDPFIHAESAGSIYIHFRNLPGELTHKLRISNHNERSRYGYKWQLRIDGLGPHIDQKHYSRYFADPDHLIKSFRSYYQKVEASQNDTLQRLSKADPMDEDASNRENPEAAPGPDRIGAASEGQFGS